MQRRWVVVLGLMPLAAGCGSEPPEPAPISGPAALRDDPDVYKPPPARNPLPPKPRKVIAPPPLPGVKKKSDAPPPLPADLDRWTEQDFAQARARDDRRLVAAVQRRAENPRGTAEEAAMLAALLQPSAAGKAGAAARLSQATLVCAVTAALGANRTTAARQTLVQLVRGEIPVTGRQAAEADALRALLRQDSPESDRAVVRLLTDLPPQNPFELQRQPPDVLRKNLVDVVRADGSARLRTELAQALTERSPPVAAGSVLRSLLCESHPLNREAQAILYRSELSDVKTRAALEKQLLLASREALELLLGFADLSPDGPALPARGYSALCSALWDPRLAGVLDLQHQALATLADRPGSVLLAASIPRSGMRAKLTKTLCRHWAEGPRAVRTAWLKDRGLVEPGFLAVLKSAERTNCRKHSAVRPVAPQKKTPEQEWNQWTEELVRYFCRRCHRAALARSAAAYRAGGDPKSGVRPAEGPVPPHPDSNVTAVYRCGGSEAGANRPPEFTDEPLRILYLRTEDRKRLPSLLAYYRRQVQRCTEHVLPDGYWLDALVEAKDEGRLRSIDVLLTRPRAGLSPPAGEAQELTVEILFVETGTFHE
ncbi:MAG: hypothetical protein JXB10_12895 [Pirellulales bacterium]|nr:hypothetical protein [Pirellulales bacterium]